MVSFLHRLVGKNIQHPSQEAGSAEQVQEEQIEVLVDFSNEFALDQIYPSLKDAIRKKPKVLTVELVGIGAIPADLCLLVWDLFTQRKDSSTRLSVWCSTSIQDGQVLFLLAADELRIRPNTWLQLSSIKQLEEMEELNKATRRRNPQLGESWHVTNYRSVVRIVSDYLPVEALAAKWRVDLQTTLRDFGLLNSDEEEAEFQSFFKREDAEV
jgi:hypothetical protein